MSERDVLLVVLVPLPVLFDEDTTGAVFVRAHYCLDDVRALARMLRSTAIHLVGDDGSKWSYRPSRRRERRTRSEKAA